MPGLGLGWERVGTAREKKLPGSVRETASGRWPLIGLGHQRKPVHATGCLPGPMSVSELTGNEPADGA
jgi:hypothetical protein